MPKKHPTSPKAQKGTEDRKHQAIRADLFAPPGHQASASAEAELQVRVFSLLTRPSLGNMTHSLRKCSRLSSEN